MSNAAQAKDPSMDDILSSIRQIISEEEVTDQAEEAVPAPEPLAAAEPVVMPEPPAPDPDPVLAPIADIAAEPEVAPEPIAPEPEIEAVVAPAEMAMSDIDLAAEPAVELDDPLELSTSDAVSPLSDSASDIASIEAEIANIDDEPVVGEDIAFDEPNDPLVVSDSVESTEEVEANSPLSLDIVDPDDVSFDDDDDIGFAENDLGDSGSNTSITMPDTSVRDEMVEDLISPATEAVASAAFANLSALSLDTTPGTIEDLIRAMLRPMLKEWLDDNLPAMVERLVQDEIERVARR